MFLHRQIVGITVFRQIIKIRGVDGRILGHGDVLLRRACQLRIEHHIDIIFQCVDAPVLTVDIQYAEFASLDREITAQLLRQ